MKYKTLIYGCTLAGLSLAGITMAWTYTNSKVVSQTTFSHTDSKNGLIATEFYEKERAANPGEGRPPFYYFRVTNNTGLPVEVSVDFEKQKGTPAGNNDKNSPTEDRDSGSDIEDPDPTIIPAGSFAEFPVLSTAGNNGKPSPLGVEATVLAKWEGGSAEIKDRLTGQDKPDQEPTIVEPEAAVESGPDQDS